MIAPQQPDTRFPPSLSLQEFFIFSALRAFLRRRFINHAVFDDRDFLRFWLTSATNNFSEQISTLAIPLTAVLVLHAGPAQMGTMMALQTLPFLLFGLPVGVWLDRRAKFPILFRTQMLFPLVLGSIPCAWWLGLLSMHWLYATSFLIGVGYVTNGSASQVYLTHLVGRERLMDAQTRFASTDSIARLIGPGIGGMLIHWLTAPITLLLNTVLFILSLWNLSFIRNHDSTPQEKDSHPVQDMIDGLKFVWHHPVLFSLAWSLAIWHILYYGFAALQILFATRELHLSPGVMGAAQTLGGLGVLVSSLLLKPLTARLGTGRTILLGMSGTLIFWLALPFTPALLFGSYWATVIWYGVNVFMFDCSVMVMILPYLTLRQRLTPDDMLGRMISTMRTLTIATAPLGAFAGGWLGEHLTLRPALFVIAACALVLVAAMIWLSPLRKASIA